MTPDERARRSAEVLLEHDRASRELGIELESVGPGRARCRLAVAERHVNGHGTCHGGVLFALADTAFAVACNARNRPAVAQHNTITYLAPAHAGDALVAEAEEVALRGRGGVCDVRVVREADGETIALFRGSSRIVGERVFEET